MKSRKMSVDLKMESYEKIMTDIQCYSCKSVPQPSTDNRRFKCFREGHSVCQGCTCPCGSGTCPNPCKVSETLVNSLPWYCSNFKHGCRELFREESALDDHKNECIYRQIKCCHPPCEQEILFKDYLDHYSNCRPDLCRVHESATSSIKLNVKDFEKDREAIYPERFEAHGNTFFFLGIVDNNHFRMWMLMLSSSSDALKNYDWSLRINGEGNENFTFCGEPFAIDKHHKDVLDEQEGFLIGCKKALKIQEKLGKFEFMIEIRNLKEDIKKEDEESGVSSDSENDKDLVSK